MEETLLETFVSDAPSEPMLAVPIREEIPIKGCDYKEGDVVTFVEDVPEEADDTYGWDEGMDRWLGATVTIKRIWDSGDGVIYLCIEEDEMGYTFGVGCIEGFTDPKIMEKAKKEREKKKESLRKKYKELVFTADRVREIAEDVYGENRVDVVEKDGRTEGFNVYIHFPEIEITNSQDGKHIIRDLYVNINVTIYLDLLGSKEDGMGEIRLFGRRRTHTLKEIESHYVHSHLPSGSHYWADFCTGYSAFRSLMDEVMFSLSEEAWTSLILSIPNYIKWESLEGGPHIPMSSISYKNRTGRATLLREIKRIGSGIPKDVWEVNGSLNVIPSHPSLKEYFNKNSEIRRMSGYEPIEYALNLAEAKVRIERQFREYPLEWKGELLSPIIYEEIMEEEGGGPIEKAVMDEFCSILQEQSHKFLKDKQYATLKRENSKNVFRETRIIEQAHTDSDKGIKEEDRLSPQQGG